MNAILARYPESSSREIPKNINMISGTNPSTPPTPSIMPEIISDFVSPSGSSDSAIPLIQPRRLSVHPTGSSL